MLAFVVVIWCALLVGFVAGTWWATRAPRPPMPQRPSPVFRRVARPSIVARVNHADADFIAVSADYIALRAEFAPADRQVLDSLVLDSLMRGKW